MALRGVEGSREGLRLVAAVFCFVAGRGGSESVLQAGRRLAVSLGIRVEG